MKTLYKTQWMISIPTLQRIKIQIFRIYNYNLKNLWTNRQRYQGIVSLIVVRINLINTKNKNCWFKRKIVTLVSARAKSMSQAWLKLPGNKSLTINTIGFIHQMVVRSLSNKDKQLNHYTRIDYPLVFSKICYMLITLTLL